MQLTLLLYYFLFFPWFCFHRLIKTIKLYVNLISLIGQRFITLESEILETGIIQMLQKGGFHNSLWFRT